MPTTEADCLDALRRAAERLGESPTKAQYEGLDIRPSSTTIRRVVGGWNEAKERAGLGTYSQDDGGGTEIRPKPDSVTIPDGEDWEDLTPQQRWYYKNRGHRIETKERRRLELRAWFTRLKRGRFACERCGEDRPAALDFHHPDSKDIGVSQMVNHGYSKRRIREEIDRCVVLCANCHRTKHREASPSAIHGEQRRQRTRGSEPPDPDVREKRRSWVMRHKRESDGCARCDVSDPICLDFHHPAAKTAGISRMLSQRYPLEAIRREVDDCVLLCANCHRVEHHGSGTETDSV